jgi:hypothetical protein
MCTAADEDLQLPPYAAVMLVLLVPAAAAAGPCLPAAVMLTEVLRVLRLAKLLPLRDPSARCMTKGVEIMDILQLSMSPRFQGLL